MSFDLPLDGVRIVALEQFGAGPFATLNLADMGAEVIKIEDPSTEGDVSRFVPPYRIEGDSLYFQSWNRNKRSLTLDLRKAEGRCVLHDLVRVVDVVFNNLRGDHPKKLGLTYESLGKINRKIVCCSLNAFGSDGPRAKEPGYDYLMQAQTGYMSITGDPSGSPAACGVSFIDHAAGFAAALGIVSKLYSVQRSGVGGDVELSLLDTAYSMLTYLAAWNLNRGFEPARYSGSAHQTLVPVQTFRTADGYITIFCGKEKFWESLCEAFGDPALAADPRGASFEARFQNRAWVVAAVQEQFLRKPTSQWLQELKGKVPCAPVNNLGDALCDPELKERGVVIEMEHPSFGPLREVNTPLRFAAPRKDHKRAPSLGEDTETILKVDLHYSDERVEDLRRAGVVHF